MYTGVELECLMLEEEEEEDQYLEQKALGNKPQKGVKCVNFRPNRGGDRFSLFNFSFSLVCWFVVRKWNIISSPPTRNFTGQMNIHFRDPRYPSPRGL